MHVDGLRVHEPVFVHQPDAVVVGGTPDAGVRRDRDAELAGHLEGGLLREGRVPRDIEGDLHAHPVVGVVAQSLQQGADGGVGRPLPRTGLDVAVGEDEAAGHRTQGLQCGLAVVDGVQVVRPVDRGRDAGVEGLDGRQPVAGGDVLRPELLPVLEVVPDEVLGERPVGAVAAHGGLPHVAVRVDHAGHHDAAPGVDLGGALGDLQPLADRGDAVVQDQDVGVPQDRRGAVHRQDRAAAEHQRATRFRGGLRHGHRLLLDGNVPNRTDVRTAGTAAMAATIDPPRLRCQERLPGAPEGARAVDRVGRGWRDCCHARLRTGVRAGGTSARGPGIDDRTSRGR